MKVINLIKHLSESQIKDEHNPLLHSIQQIMKSGPSLQYFTLLQGEQSSWNDAESILTVQKV